MENVASLLIEEAKQVVKEDGAMKMRVLPMYGALPTAEQVRVFERTPKNCRKVSLFVCLFSSEKSSKLTSCDLSYRTK